jgi:hypothetical protein
MTDVITTVLASVMDWEVNLLVDYGPLWFLIIHAVGLLVLWCGAGLAVHAYEQRVARRRQEAAE